MNINLTALASMRNNPKEYYQRRADDLYYILPGGACVDMFRVNKRKRLAYKLLRYFGGRI